MCWALPNVAQHGPSIAWLCFVGVGLGDAHSQVAVASVLCLACCVLQATMACGVGRAWGMLDSS